jgi:hypothetical protein
VGEFSEQHAFVPDGLDRNWAFPRHRPLTIGLEIILLGMLLEALAQLSYVRRRVERKYICPQMTQMNADKKTGMVQITRFVGINPLSTFAPRKNVLSRSESRQ